MVENEQNCREIIHFFVKKMMDEIDKIQSCKICGKDHGIGIVFDTEKSPICIGCLNILIDNIDDLDDKVSKAIGKAKQK